jgi:hypothetical protein
MIANETAKMKRVFDDRDCCIDFVASLGAPLRSFDSFIDFVVVWTLTSVEMSVVVENISVSRDIVGSCSKLFFVDEMKSGVVVLVDVAVKS